MKTYDTAPPLWTSALHWSGQQHVLAALLSGKKHRYPLQSRLIKLVWTLWSRDKNVAPAGNRTAAVLPVARRHTDWAIVSPNSSISSINSYGSKPLFNLQELLFHG
jgi:hypothetical protein